MTSYFRKMMARSMGSRSSGSVTSDDSTSQPPSYPPVCSSVQDISHGYPSKYDLGTATPQTPRPPCRELSSHSPVSNSWLRWDEKQSLGYGDLKEAAVNSGYYQYPAKQADHWSVYSQMPSSSQDSVSSFGTCSSSSSASPTLSSSSVPPKAFSSSTSLSSSTSSHCRGKRTPKVPSSVLKGSPKNVSSTASSCKTKCRVSFKNPLKPLPTHIHPLFAMNPTTTATKAAPIQCNISVPPIPGAIRDYLGNKIPLCTLMEPATEPPTKGSLTLASDMFPWPIVVTPRCASTPHAYDAKNIYSSHRHANQSPYLSTSAKKERKFFIDSSDSGDDDDGDSEQGWDSADDDVITNLDVLHAIHTTLSLNITQSEWDDLAAGSASSSPKSNKKCGAEAGSGGKTIEQRRVARTYRRRCQEKGDDLRDGVKRIDFLTNRTLLVGIVSRKVCRSTKGLDPFDGESGEEQWAEGVDGKLVFAEER